MLKTRVRASLERPGPHRGELHECSNPTECRMHMGQAGHTQPNRAQKSNPPRNPQQEPRKGEDQPDGGFPENPQRTSGNPGSAAATFFKQWPIRPVLGAAKLCSLRFEATGSRGVLKQGGDQSEQRTPPPPTQDGARGTQVPVGSEYTTPPPKG